MEVRLKKIWLALVVVLLAAGVASGQLGRRVDAIVGRPSQSKVQFSIHIAKAKTGKMVYSRNAKEPLIPASNMKLITSAAALKYLGPTYEYVTRVALCDDAVVVIGSGDPLLGDEKTNENHGRQAGWVFEDMAAALKERGIEAVKGIIVDSTIFDDQRVHPNWAKEDLNRWYACEVSGLNYYGNCVDITAKTVGGKVVASMQPRTGFVKLVNQIVPITSGRNTVGAYRNQKENVIILKGKCKKEAGPFSVAIERPAAFFGYLVAEKLIEAQIEPEGELIEKAVDRDCRLKVLRQYRHSLADCLARCNKDSFGLAAEALFKTIAAESEPSRKGGSWGRGRQMVSKYLADLGISFSEFYIDDASGLSRQNKLSANAITKVLLAVYRSRNWDLYKDSLAVGGVDGTIKKYFKEQKYKGKVFGKTGYIRGVKTFSGIATGRGGEDYLFSVLANKSNGKTRAAINDIAKAIVDSN